MLGGQIGRAENESARDGIELNEGQRRRELIPGRGEARVQQHEIVGQRRQRLLLLSGDLLEPSGDHGPHRHRRRHHDPPTPVVMMRWISAPRSSTPVSSFAAGSRSGTSAISASSARKSSCVWTTSQTPCTSVYSYSDEPCRLARSAR